MPPAVRMSILSQSNPRTVESEPEKMDRVGQRQHGGRLLLPGWGQNCGLSTGAAFGRWKPSWNPESEYLRVYLLYLWALSFSLPWLRCCLKNYNITTATFPHASLGINNHPSKVLAFRESTVHLSSIILLKSFKWLGKFTQYIFSKIQSGRTLGFRTFIWHPPCPIIWEGLS